MSPILTGVIASGISGQLNAWSPEGAFDALASTTVSAGGVASVTFSGIPTGYKHLQIRTLIKTSSASPDMLMQFNGDTGSNYNFHILRGNNLGVVTGERYVNASISNPVSDVFQPAIIDVLDYNSSLKNKTSKILVGRDNNGAGDVGLWSHLWFAPPQAITSIRFIPTTGSIAQDSSFAIYGVK